MSKVDQSWKLFRALNVASFLILILFLLWYFLKPVSEDTIAIDYLKKDVIELKEKVSEGEARIGKIMVDIDTLHIRKTVIEQQRTVNHNNYVNYITRVMSADSAAQSALYSTNSARFDSLIYTSGIIFHRK